MRAASVLNTFDRDDFLRAVAHELAGREPLGDGIVGRVCAELQKRFWRPPERSTDASTQMRRQRIAPEGRGLAHGGT